MGVNERLGRESFFFLRVSVRLFTLHGHKELNDNLWDGHTKELRRNTRRGKKKCIGSSRVSDHGGRTRDSG